MPLGACLLRVPARRRRHAVQPKAGGSAHETTAGGRCSPTYGEDVKASAAKSGLTQENHDPARAAARPTGRAA